MHEAATKLYALVADRIWTGNTDIPVTNSAVVVTGTLIQSIVPINDLPKDMHRVNLDGCTLIPGMIDAHVHYSSAMGPTMLAAGVTTIRDVGNNLEWIINQRDLNRKNPTLGPTILCCGHLQDGPKVFWPRLGLPHINADSIRETIRRHASAGVDAIKLYDGLTPELLTAAVDEGHQHGKFVTAHLGMTSAKEAALAGVDGIEHLSRCDVAWKDSTKEEDNALVDILLQHDVSLDPTLVVWDRLARILDHSFIHDRRRQWVHPTHLQIWDYYQNRFDPPAKRQNRQIALPHLKRFLRRAHKRGVPIALGTDTPWPHLVPGFSVHDELSMYVDAGIQPVDALRSATSINAHILGIESTAGQIAPGISADMVAIQGNPLERIEDIGNVEATVRAGHVLYKDLLLEKTQRSFNQKLDDTITMELLDVTEHPDLDPSRRLDTSNIRFRAYREIHPLEQDIPKNGD